MDRNGRRLGAALRDGSPHSSPGQSRYGNVYGEYLVDAYEE